LNKIVGRSTEDLFFVGGTLYFVLSKDAKETDEIRNPTFETNDESLKKVLHLNPENHQITFSFNLIVNDENQRQQIQECNG
jgi:hypothetical protein